VSLEQRQAISGITFLMQNNNFDNNIEFIKRLNSETKLTLWILFDRLKYHKLTVGGFLPKKYYSTVCKSLNISDSKLRKGLSAMAKLGWVNKTYTGYQFQSWRLIPELYDVEIKKLIFKGENKADLINKATAKYVKKNLLKQFYTVNKKMTDNWLTNNAEAKLQESDYTLSVRHIASIFGFKSAMTGSRIEKRMVKKKLIKIERQQQEVCLVKDLHSFHKANPELWHHTFIKGNRVYRRLTNNLIVN